MASHDCKANVSGLICERDVSLDTVRKRENINSSNSTRKQSFYDSSSLRLTPIASEVAEEEEVVDDCPGFMLIVPVFTGKTDLVSIEVEDGLGLASGIIIGPLATPPLLLLLPVFAETRRRLAATRLYRSAGRRIPLCDFMGGSCWVFFVRAISRRASRGGGPWKDRSICICTAMPTSSLSMFFFFAYAEKS